MKLSWRPTFANTWKILLISALTIVSFMLLQFAFIDLFVYWGLSISNVEVTIDNSRDYLTYVVMVCIFPAVFEELVFRLLIFWGMLWLLNKHKIKHASIYAIIISALIFAIYHMNFAQLVYQFILGIIYATVFLKTRNFLYPVILHFINNFFVVTYTYITGDGAVSYTWNALTIITMLLLCLVGSCIILNLVKTLKKEHHDAK